MSGVETPDRLRSILEGISSSTTTDGIATSNLSLAEWNVELETFLSADGCQTTSYRETFEPLVESSLMVAKISVKLHGILCHFLMMSDFDSDIVCLEDDATSEALAKSVVAAWREKENCAAFIKRLLLHDDQLRFLSEIIRSCKNWLRWFLQIFLSAQDSGATVNGSSVLKPIKLFQSNAMLELYLILLDRFCGDIGDESGEELARYVSQLMFFATYDVGACTVPSGLLVGDNDIAEAPYEFLVNKINFFPRILSLLVSIKTTGLALSLIRNIHSLTVSFPGGREHMGISVSLSSSPSEMAPWIQNNSSESSSNNNITITCTQVLCNVILWCLSSDPHFPGDREDLRAEIVVEILRTFYACRLGEELKIPTKHNRLKQVILELLQLDSKTDDDRCYECQLSTISLLMDSDPSFGQALVSNGQTVYSLLDIMKRQLSIVQEKQLVDNSGAAALTPILVVLYKFCQSNAAFRQQTKKIVFPVAAEKNFQRLAQQQRSKKANMVPLDAPKGTLRQSVIGMLTWPESHVKRFAGELLWTLSNQDAQEFVHRVGMGNAMVILHSKGVVQLPSSAMQT